MRFPPGRTDQILPESFTGLDEKETCWQRKHFGGAPAFLTRFSLLFQRPEQQPDRISGSRCLRWTQVSQFLVRISPIRAHRHSKRTHTHTHTHTHTPGVRKPWRKIYLYLSVRQRKECGCQRRVRVTLCVCVCVCVCVVLVCVCAFWQLFPRLTMVEGKAKTGKAS